MSPVVLLPAVDDFVLIGEAVLLHVSIYNMAWRLLKKKKKKTGIRLWSEAPALHATPDFSALMAGRRNQCIPTASYHPEKYRCPPRNLLVLKSQWPRGHAFEWWEAGFIKNKSQLVLHIWVEETYLHIYCRNNDLDMCVRGQFSLLWLSKHTWLLACNLIMWYLTKIWVEIIRNF